MTLGYTPIKTEEPEVLLTFMEHLANARHQAGARETAKHGTWLTHPEALTRCQADK